MVSKQQKLHLEIILNFYMKGGTGVFLTTQSKSTKESKLKRWKRKSKLITESRSKKARLDYGSETLDVEPDVSAEELNINMDDFKININESEMEKLEKNTKDQSNSDNGVQRERKE